MELLYTLVAMIVFGYGFRWLLKKSQDIRHQPAQVITGPDNQEIQTLVHEKKEIFQTVLLFSGPLLLLIAAAIDSESHDLWDVLFFFVAIAVITSPVFFWALRPCNRTYSEDDRHFESLTRLTNRKIHMPFEEIACVETSYNPGFFWICSKDGQRVELPMKFHMPYLLDYLYQCRTDRPDIFDPSRCGVHVAPLRSRLFNSRHNRFQL